MKQSLEERFLEAYDAHADAIFRFCYAQTGRRELARDLTQDTFTRVWKHLNGGAVIDEIRPFLYRTARNAVIDHSRRGQAQSLDVLQESGFDVIDEHAPDPSVQATAAHAIAMASRLEQPYREAVLMRYVDELMPREIAAITGESENTISVRITRGMEKLRDLLHI